MFMVAKLDMLIGSNVIGLKSCSFICTTGSMLGKFLKDALVDDYC